MSKSLLRRPSPALAVSIVALVVALGGTAYAGSLIPSNSVGTTQLQNGAVTTKKIKNGAVTTSKITNGAVTASKINASGLTVPNALHANNADSATNAGNATNAVNATNAANATHASTAGSATNATHASTADNATSANAPGTLASGKTEVGIWEAGAVNPPGGSSSCCGFAGITFPNPLASAPTTVHYIQKGAPVPGGCSGNVSNPGASPGNLCVFEGRAFNVSVFRGIEDPTDGGVNAANRFGTGVYTYSGTTAGEFDAGGSWAVTAP